MTRLEELTPGARVAGVLPPAPVIVVAAQWHGTNALTLTYRADDGTTGAELLYRDDEARLRIEAPGAAFAFDGDGALFRPASEASWLGNVREFEPR